MDVANHYHKRFSIDIKAEVEDIEDKVKEKRGNTSTKEANEKIHWIPDTGFSRSRDTKFFRMVELY
jgi:hypothetical protein